ncbi:MAG TPA: phosphoribosylglycinamide formyltransferase [Candidatus Thermoplasmatota archaeon]|nr:phosphoribosylglycinamide formyltransferase [Candidatus Thermoplasmatota archaeon]
MLRVAVLASGKGSNLQALLTRIAAGDVDAKVVLVVSDRPDAGALDVARGGKVPALLALPPEPGEKRTSYDARLLEALQREHPDLVVLAGYMRIAGPALVRAFAGRIINIHPALLPDFRGLHAVRQALAAGVERAGCTTHIVTDDLDGGPLLLQAWLRVRPGEDESSLQQRILRLEHLVLPRTVQLFAEGRVRTEGGKASLLPGPPSSSWLARQDLPLVSGAHYGEGF